MKGASEAINELIRRGMLVEQGALRSRHAPDGSDEGRRLERGRGARSAGGADGALMLVDANHLLYSVDEESRFHVVARNWLTEALNGPQRVAIPWVSLWAFYQDRHHQVAGIG